jgi:hypothetical protein
MFWLLFAMAPFLIGLVLGAFTAFPVRWLAAPALALAFTYWIGVGWYGDDYDIGRSGLVVFTGALGGLVVALWILGCGVGRLVRRDFAAR